MRRGESAVKPCLVSVKPHIGIFIERRYTGCVASTVFEDLPDLARQLASPVDATHPNHVLALASGRNRSRVLKVDSATPNMSMGDRYPRRNEVPNFHKSKETRLCPRSQP
jgi:hypothetical protein